MIYNSGPFCIICKVDIECVSKGHGTVLVNSQDVLLTNLNQYIKLKHHWCFTEFDKQLHAIDYRMKHISLSCKVCISFWGKENQYRLEWHTLKYVND